MENIRNLSIYGELQMYHNQEIENCDRYMQLSETADREGFHHVAGILRDMATEEKQHSKILSHILED